MLNFVLSTSFSDVMAVIVGAIGFIVIMLALAYLKGWFEERLNK